MSKEGKPGGFYVDPISRPLRDSQDSRKQGMDKTFFRGEKVEKTEKPTMVLVVDDDQVVRTFVRVTLEQIGFEVCEASDGSQALEQFMVRRPDIIVLDVTMPVMDGYTACSRLRGSAGGTMCPS